MLAQHFSLAKTIYAERYVGKKTPFKQMSAFIFIPLFFLLKILMEGRREEMHLLRPDTKYQLAQCKAFKEISVKRKKLLQIKRFCQMRGWWVLFE